MLPGLLFKSLSASKNSCNFPFLYSLVKCLPFNVSLVEKKSLSCFLIHSWCEIAGEINQIVPIYPRVHRRLDPHVADLIQKKCCRSQTAEMGKFLSIF